MKRGKILPKAMSSSGVFGYTDPRLFDGEKIPIAGIAGDQHASTFGQTCFKPGMVKNTYGTALAMVMDSGKNLDSLRVDAGAVENEFLMQFQADILGVPVEKQVVTEMAALGAAYLAGLAVGFWKDREELVDQWKIEKVYEPMMSSAKREGLYGGWKRAVVRSLCQGSALNVKNKLFGPAYHLSYSSIRIRPSE